MSGLENINYVSYLSCISAFGEPLVVICFDRYSSISGEGISPQGEFIWRELKLSKSSLYIQLSISLAKLVLSRKIMKTTSKLL